MANRYTRIFDAGGSQTQPGFQRFVCKMQCSSIDGAVQANERSEGMIILTFKSMPTLEILCMMLQPAKMPLT